MPRNPNAAPKGGSIDVTIAGAIGGNALTPPDERAQLLGAGALEAARRQAEKDMKVNVGRLAARIALRQ